jgi:hypothetical protein
MDFSRRKGSGRLLPLEKCVCLGTRSKITLGKDDSSSLHVWDLFVLSTRYIYYCRRGGGDPLTHLSCMRCFILYEIPRLGIWERTIFIFTTIMFPYLIIFVFLRVESYARDEHGVSYVSKRLLS